MTTRGNSSDKLGRLLADAAAAAPRRHQDAPLPGEDDAVLAFRAARLEEAAADTGRKRRIPLARGLTVKAGVLALGLTVFGGVGVAAATGTLPHVFGGKPPAAPSVPSVTPDGGSKKGSIRPSPDGSCRPPSRGGVRAGSGQGATACVPSPESSELGGHGRPGGSPYEPPSGRPTGTPARAGSPVPGLRASQTPAADRGVGGTAATGSRPV